MYGVPAINADCLVAEIDGPGKWELLKASKYNDVKIIAGSLIQFNDGSLGGLSIVGKVEDNINTLKNYIKDTLEPAI